MLFAVIEGDEEGVKHVEWHEMASFDCDKVSDVKENNQNEIKFSTSVTLPNYYADGVLYKKVFFTIINVNNNWQVDQMEMNADSFEATSLCESEF